MKILLADKNQTIYRHQTKIYGNRKIVLQKVNFFNY